MQDSVLHTIDQQGNPDSPSHAFWCPGCKCAHAIWTTGKVAWGFNGSLDKPTFTPSILINAGRENARCHLHVRDGNLAYCQDCDHEYKGQTIPMVKF